MTAVVTEIVVVTAVVIVMVPPSFPDLLQARPCLRGFQQRSCQDSRICKGFKVGFGLEHFRVLGFGFRAAVTSAAVFRELPQEGIGHGTGKPRSRPT